MELNRLLSIKCVLLAGLMILLCGTPAMVFATELDDYQRDVDLYRTAHNLYEIKKGEYSQFGTFGAEEDLVKAAQDMLLTRDDAWISYWHLLSVKTSRLKALPDEKKQARQVNLQSEIDWLIQHKKRTVSTKTRRELLIVAQEVNKKSETYGPLSFALNSEITINTLIEIAQSLAALNLEITKRAEVQQLEASQKDIKLRGLSVNKERIDADLTKLSISNQKLNDSSGYGNVEMFNRILEEANPVYADLTQLYQVLSELSEGVEW